MEQGLLGPRLSVVTPSVGVMNDDLSDLDASGLLAAASDSVRARRLAEVRELQVLAAWAALHSGEPTDRWDRLVQLGGEGTPLVQDLSLGEIALARGSGVMATHNAIADALDLIHRLPLTWARCATGEVDRAVARVIGRESAGRVLAVAEAKIIEADPALHEERVEAERRRRYVSSSRTDEFGLRTVIARVEAGDAVWVDAIVARVAGIIAPRYPDASPDELRSIAFGWLARPAELLLLLLEHRDQQETLDLGEDVTPARATAFPADLLHALREADLTPLGPEGGAVRPSPPGRDPRPPRGRPGRGPRSRDVDRAADAARAHRADREAGAGPVRPGPDHRLRAPRVPQRTRPPDHRRRLLALRHLHRQEPRLRPPHRLSH